MMVNEIRNNFINDCTFLINTCDGYADCWDGFFKLLKIQWKDFPLKIILNTERKSYSFDGFDITVLNQIGGKQAWGKRLINVLKRIDTKYVVFALEDFYLDASVNEAELIKCYQYMENNPHIACFSFLPTDDKENIPSSDYPYFEKRPMKSCPYKLNCQMAIWNKEKLTGYIRSHESPWEWEIYGSRRSGRYKEEFYSIRPEYKNLIFSYQNGGVIRRGRWSKEVVLPLEEKYNLGLDLSHRGIFEDFCGGNFKRKRNIIRGIKNRINKIRSLI